MSLNKSGAYLVRKAAKELLWRNPDGTAVFITAIGSMIMQSANNGLEVCMYLTYCGITYQTVYNMPV